MKATADSIRRSIGLVEAELNRLGLLADRNEVVVERLEKSKKRVTWATVGTRVELSRFKDSTVEEYLLFYTGRHFNFRLVDGALIQISYDLTRYNDVEGCRLVWFPCPIDFDGEDLEFSDIEELILTTPRKNIGCRSPIRIDYAPTMVADGHPSAHLHLGFEDFRLPVQRPIEPRRFIRFLIRNRYNSLWRNNADGFSCEDWGAADKLTPEDKSVGSLMFLNA